MIDTSGKSFADFQNRLDARAAIIVKIMHDSDVWYLGDMEIEWGAGIHVYALLTGCTGMKRTTDPFRKKWSIGEVTLSFSNLPFKKDSSGNWLRPSDDISIIETDSVEIYLLCGENATGLSDCILSFSGLLKESPKYDENTWSITIIDRSVYLLNQTILSTTVGSIYSDTPEKFENEMIPLVYGEFRSGFSSDYALDDLGLAKGIPINSNVPPKCVFCNKRTHTFSYMYYQESGIDQPSIQASANLYVNEYGRTTGTPNTQQVIIYIPHENSNHDGYYLPYLASKEPDDPDLAYDKDGTTYCEGWDGFDDNSQMYSSAAFGFSSDLDGAVDSILNKAIHQSNGSWGWRYKIGPSADITFNASEIYFWNNSDGSSANAPSGTGLAATYDNTWRNTSMLTIDMTADFGTDPGRKRFCACVTAGSISGADGTINNKHIMRVYELWLRISYDEPGGSYTWGELKGRTFDSWIDNPGHSNSFNSGDLIEDPAYIIESLLRDELNWATANIDEASFDDAANSSVIMRMNLTKQATVAKIIRQICEQSTFAFHVNSAGKARLIPLNDSSPTTDRTIPFSHIKQNTLKISVSQPKVNKLTVESRWRGQNSKYQDIDVIENSSSQGAYGTKEYPVKWPNIAGTSREHIANHLVGNMFSLWAFQKTVVELEAFGFTNADLEIGDWIELDDETWNAQVKLYGASWSGIKFLVTEITQKQDGTRIKAVAI